MDDDTDIDYICQELLLGHVGRINFPDRTSGQPGDDSFVLMAERGIQVVDRVVIEEMGSDVDLDKDVWRIPGTEGKIVPAKY
jgi:hypothetical protein